MPLDLINESGLEIDSKIFETVLDLLKEAAFLDKEKEICLQLCADNTIKDFNKKYRGKNSLTDVLSFPNDFKDIPFLGDIMIDVNIADNQKEDRSLNQELAVLFLHGVLHLLGYDHININDKKKMGELENRFIPDILDKIKGVR